MSTLFALLSSSVQNTFWLSVGGKVKASYEQYQWYTDGTLRLDTIYVKKLVSSEPIEQMLSLRLALSPSLVKWKPKKPCILFGCWDGLTSVRQKSPGKSFEVDEYEGKIEPVFTAQTIFFNL